MLKLIFKNRENNLIHETTRVGRSVILRHWLELTMALTKFRVQFTLLWNKQLRLVVVCDVS